MTTSQNSLQTSIIVHTLILLVHTQILNDTKNCTHIVNDVLLLEAGVGDRTLAFLNKSQAVIDVRFVDFVGESEAGLYYL